ncbi:lytic transglycosylase domain-containing protein [Alteromonas sp. C1M14]|uniref:lytic transglycosylase domain-containing protein n=1 Tax=Alteromonas sp. C1M14 TaxID=2841567 RepID=UPI001C097B3A|nr:lytic transglycosylase domain-containing protein [Alteromonas sp. C1M14]MBU2978207.1 lytic transglycosylase domain-containing protein [Alteromonas sp. C1M14]
MIQPPITPLSLVLLLFVLTFCPRALAYSPYQQSDIEQIIITESVRQSLPPSLALAIAKAESGFDPYALSHAGARGVMQIMPATAEGEFSVPASRLYEPTTNIRIGVAFIKQLIKTYGGRVDIALSHYNGGSAVKDKNNNYRIIPATKAYVSKVLAYQKKYQHDGLDSRFYSAYGDGEYSHFYEDDTLASASMPSPTLTIDARHDSRIEALQKLRVHNLTRSAGEVQTSLTRHAVLPYNAATTSKRAKVAQWESIYKE